MRSVTMTLPWDTGANPKQVVFTPDGREVWTSLLSGRGVHLVGDTIALRLYASDWPTAVVVGWPCTRLNWSRATAN